MPEPADPRPPAVVVQAYPDALPLTTFLATASRELQEVSVDPAAALAVVATCRDEMMGEFRAVVRRHWHKAFDFSSLSGLPLAGVTGMTAVLGHAPLSAERVEVVIFAMPHVGILADGTPGLALRRGRVEPTTACGSLAAAVSWAQDVRRDPISLADPLDPLDPEQALVRLGLLRRIPDLADLGMLQLVEHVRSLMVEDLWALVEATTDPRSVDVALVSGVLVHGPDGTDYVQPGGLRLRADGELLAE